MEAAAEGVFQLWRVCVLKARRLFMLLPGRRKRKSAPRISKGRREAVRDDGPRARERGSSAWARGRRTSGRRALAPLARGRRGLSRSRRLGGVRRSSSSRSSCLRSIRWRASRTSIVRAGSSRVRCLVCFSSTSSIQKRAMGVVAGLCFFGSRTAVRSTRLSRTTPHGRVRWSGALGRPSRREPRVNEARCASFRALDIASKREISAQASKQATGRLRARAGPTAPTDPRRRARARCRGRPSACRAKLPTKWTATTAATTS